MNAFVYETNNLAHYKGGFMKKLLYIPVLLAVTSIGAFGFEDFKRSASKAKDKAKEFATSERAKELAKSAEAAHTAGREKYASEKERLAARRAEAGDTTGTAQRSSRFSSFLEKGKTLGRSALASGTAGYGAYKTEQEKRAASAAAGVAEEPTTTTTAAEAETAATTE